MGESSPWSVDENESMSARKFRDSWWVDLRDPQGQRHRVRSPENSKAGAQAFEAVLRQKLAKGEPIEKERTREKEMTLEKFSAQWFQLYVVVHNKPSEQRNKRLALDKHLLPFFGKMPLGAIGVADIERFKLAKLQENLKAKTINNYLCTLSRCLGSAVDWELLDHKPRIKLLKVEPQPSDYLSHEESIKLVESCDEPMWKQMILLALHTGMRLGELFGLEWSDISFEQKTLTVRQSIVRGHIGTPKSNKIRYIPLTEEVCRLLYEGRGQSGLVFHREDGNPLSHHIAERALDRARKKADLRHIGWHKLRHTFASHLAMEGVSMRAIQELLGHSTIVMTQRYAHLSPSALRDAIVILERRHEKAVTDNFGQPVGNIEKLLEQIVTK